MRIAHFMKKEKSGLAFTTLELAQAEIKQGHQVIVQEPSDKDGNIGPMLYGQPLDADVECIHSQLPLTSYHNGKPKFLWCHGEPLSSVANGVSMKAILEMTPKVDAFIAMRRDEWSVWNSIKRTYLVPKGIDLVRFHPMELKPEERLSGEPAILYLENWRKQRNPLYLLVAMEQVWRKLPKARLHLFNCNDQKMLDTFNTLIKHNKYWPFVKTLKGAVADSEVNRLYNRADIVVSCLYPLYARSIEAFGAGKCFIGPGYRENDYPFQCDLSPESMAQTIVRAWENQGLVNYRKWAEQYHDVDDTVRQCIDIYGRYL